MILLEGVLFFNENIKTYQIFDEIGKIFDKSKFIIKDMKLHYKSDEETKPDIKLSIYKSYHINKKRKEIFARIIFESFSQEDEGSEESFDNLDENIKNDIRDIRNIFNIGKRFPTFKDNKIEKIIFTKDAFAKDLLKKSYPLIFDIENSMRTLIFNTMTFKANKEWFKKELPDDIEIKPDRKDYEIFGLDFSHLSKILFDRNEKGKLGKLLENLEEIDDCKNLDISQIKKLIPKSNWKKYFSAINLREKLKSIKETLYKDSSLTDEKTIKKLLEDIQSDRNKIAHNNISIDNDFKENLEEKVRFLEEWIHYAVDDLIVNIDQNTRSRLEAETTGTNQKMISYIDDLIEKVANYYHLDKTEKLYKFIKDNFYEDNDTQYRHLRKIIYYIELKNKIINEIKIIDQDDLKNHLDDIEELLNKMQNYPTVDIGENDIETIEAEPEYTR